MYRYYKWLFTLGVVKLSIIAVIIIAAGVGGWFAWTSTQSPTQTKVAANLPTPVIIPKDFKIERHSTGGIAGKGDGNDLSLTSAGILTNIKTTKIKGLTYGDLESLVKETNAAKFFTLNDSYSSGNTCSDSMSTTLIITMDGRTKQVSWSNCSANVLPPGLDKIGEHLLLLAASTK
jgi:hypothetical protein